MNRTSEEIETADIDLLLVDPHPRNPRMHPDHQIKRLMKSLERFGQIKPIVVQRRGNGRFHLVAGNGFTEAARRAGRRTLEAKILPQGWTDAQCDGYTLADNQRGDDDEERLIDLWEEQVEAGYELDSVGISLEEFEAIRAQHDQFAVEPEGDVRPTLVSAAKARQQIKPVLTIEQVHIFEQALKKTGLRNRGEAITAVCQAYLTGTDWTGE